MEDLFTNRKPNVKQEVMLDKITQQMNETAGLLAVLLKDSRYKSLAFTNLEQCSMWAKKCVLFAVED
jgi:hypothetical protein